MRPLISITVATYCVIFSGVSVVTDHPRTRRSSQRWLTSRRVHLRSPYCHSSEPSTDEPWVSSHYCHLITYLFTIIMQVVGAGMVICLERGADLHMAQLMPLPLTVFCFSKIQIGFTFLVLAHPGSPGQRAVKQCTSIRCV